MHTKIANMTKYWTTKGLFYMGSKIKAKKVISEAALDCFSTHSQY